MNEESQQSDLKQLNYVSFMKNSNDFNNFSG